jgi:ornithine decarboxylase
MTDAFYVVNVDDIVYKYNNWKTKMTNIQPYYAVKCNNNPIVLEILAALNIGFDCASKAEIESVLDTGTPASKILYANPCKSRPYLEYAKKVHVSRMTFDNVEELKKIKELYPQAELVLRIKVDDSHSKYHLSMKFGANMRQVPMLLEKAKELKLKVIGVSFHVGSGCESSDAYKDAIFNAKIAFTLGMSLGHPMNLLDIGGGFPGGSDPKEKMLFDRIAESVLDAVSTHFPPSMGVSVIAEPGRYFVQSAFTLTANIITMRPDVLEDGTEVMMYYINDGLYGSFSNTTFEEGEIIPIPEIPEKELFQRMVKPTVIWGPTCDSLDCIQKKIFLPEMKVGEWMTFTDMGAYTLSLGTKFNGFSMPLVKCHASPEVIQYLEKVPSFKRLAAFFGITVEEVAKSKTKKSIVYKIWNLITVHH